LAAEGKQGDVGTGSQRIWFPVHASGVEVTALGAFGEDLGFPLYGAGVR
jgi:hypothetical protein